MSLREIKPLNLKTYAESAYQQLSYSVAVQSKNVEINLAGQEYTFKVTSPRELLVFKPSITKIILKVLTPDTRVLTLYFSITSLNFLLKYIKFPQAISQMTEECLTSLMELLIASFFEIVLNEPLKLFSLDIVSEMSEPPDSNDDISSVCYEVYSSEAKVFSFYLKSSGCFSVLEQRKESLSLVNIKIPVHFGFAQVHLQEQELHQLEVGDFLPITMLIHGAVVPIYNEHHFIYSDEQQKNELSKIESFNVVYKSMHVSLFSLMSKKITVQELMLNLGAVFLKSDGMIVVGHIVIIHEQYFFTLINKTTVK